MGCKNSRLCAIIQAASSIEGNCLSHCLTHSITHRLSAMLSFLMYNFLFSAMLSYPYVFLNFQGGDASVNSVHLFPRNSDHIVVCNKTSSIYIMTLQGQVYCYLHIPSCLSTVFCFFLFKKLSSEMFHLSANLVLTIKVNFLTMRTP